MKFVQKAIWFVATIAALVLEMIIRVVILFPFGLFITIMASFFGAKYWIHDNPFLDYCCPWKFGSKNLPIAWAISRWFDPDTF